MKTSRSTTRRSSSASRSRGRDLHVVLTKTEAKAQQARKRRSRAAACSRRWSRSTRSTRPRGTGRPAPAVSEGQQEPAFDKAIFEAKKGGLEGPVKTQFGWYVFEVDKITEARSRRSSRRRTRSRTSALRAPAEDARQVDQGVPRGVQGRDQLRGGLPGPGVQERSEGEDRHRSGLGRQPARNPQAAAAAGAPASVAASS